LRAAAAAARKEQAAKNKPNKLTYKEQKELEDLPDKISKLEDGVKAVEQEMAEPDFYSRDYEEVGAATEKLEGLNAELESATERWLELEERQEQLRAAKQGR